MKRSLSRILYLLALLLWGLGAVLNGLAVQGIFGYAGVGIPFAILGILLYSVSWIGSLVKTIQLGRWGWFICLLILSAPTLLVYIFWGPQTPAYQP
ncbi:MAG: hypothetical protein ABI413_20385 [Ktedonobacteraceae bacterium]